MKESEPQPFFYTPTIATPSLTEAAFRVSKLLDCKADPKNEECKERMAKGYNKCLGITCQSYLTALLEAEKIVRHEMEVNAESPLAA